MVNMRMGHKNSGDFSCFERKGFCVPDITIFRTLEKTAINKNFGRFFIGNSSIAGSCF